MLIPEDLDFREVKGLSIEVQQRLNLHHPESLGQAMRISGVTPAAISVLMVYLKRNGALKREVPNVNCDEPG